MFNLRQPALVYVRCQTWFFVLIVCALTAARQTSATFPSSDKSAIAPRIAQDNFGRTALHLLAMRCSPVSLETAKALVDGLFAEADGVEDVLGETPLEIAVKHNCIEIVEFFLSKNMNCSRLNRQGYTPLHIARRFGFDMLVDVMTETGKCSLSQIDSCRTAVGQIKKQPPFPVDRCEPFPSIKNANLTIPQSDFPYCIGSQVQLTCNAGCRLRGSDIVECNPNGKWEANGHCDSQKETNEPWPQPDNLIGFWPLTFNFELQDIGTNHNNGDAQIQAFTTGPFGIQDSAARQTADNDQILSVSNSSHISVEDSSFTVSLFFKRGGSASSGGIFEFLDRGSTTRAFQFRYENATTFELSANSATIGHISMIEKNGGWTYIALVYDNEDGTLTVYGKDGMVLPATSKPQLWHSLAFSNNGLRVGYSTRFQQGLSTNDAVACLMVYSTALTSEHVQKAYDACRNLGAPLCSDALPGIENGRIEITPNSTAIGSKAVFACNSAYIHLGANVVECTSDGFWRFKGFCSSLTDIQAAAGCSNQVSTTSPVSVTEMITLPRVTTPDAAKEGLQVQLRESAKSGDIEKVRQLLQKGILDVNWRRDDDNDGCCCGHCLGVVRYGTALHHATHKNPGNVYEIVRLLVDNGADVNLKEITNGYTALMMTAWLGNLETVRLLLDRTADVEAKDNYGNTALMHAGYNGQLETVRLLLDRGADINAKRNDGETALTLFQVQLRESAKTGDLQKVHQLLLLGILDVNWRRDDDNDGCCCGHCLGVVRYGTALHHATHKNPGNVYEIVRLLVDNGADVNLKEITNGYTALTMIAWLGNVETVRLLLDRKADVEAKDNYGNTALMHAGYNGQLETVRLLLDRGADINAKQNDGETALTLFQVQLRESAKTGDVQKVRQLLQLGILDVNWRRDDDNDGCCCGHCLGVVRYGTALHHATHKNPGNIYEIVRLLVDNGADVNLIEITNGYPALTMIAWLGNLETVRLLLDQKADINATDNGGGTALMNAGMNSQLETVRLLLDRNADINAKDNGSRTTLMWAALLGKTEILHLLKSRGASMDGCISSFSANCNV